MRAGAGAGAGSREPEPRAELCLRDCLRYQDDIGYKVDETYVNGVMELFAKFDEDTSGQLEFDEFKALWEFLQSQGVVGEPGKQEKKATGNVAREVARLQKKMSGLNDDYVKELQEHRYDVEEMRVEFTRLRTEQIALRQDVEIERQARIAAEERATRVGALKQMDELKQLAVQAVAEAEEAREEAEEATELALAFETEADGYKRDVEHLEKTARNLKSKNKKLEFDLQRMQKGGALKGIRGGAKYLDEDEVAKIYGKPHPT